MQDKLVFVIKQLILVSKKINLDNLVNEPQYFIEPYEK